MATFTNGMGSRLLRGAASGAVGTTVLNVVTYGDMLLRGRPSSSVPAKAAGKLANAAGLGALGTVNDAPEAENRRQAAGALLGYVTGVSVGAAYAVALQRSSAGHRFHNGLLLGLIAMAVSDVPIVLTGASDPRTWSRTAWLADIVPHMAYGLATAAALDGFGGLRTRKW